jgi:small subunit ribosomal protein S13
MFTWSARLTRAISNGKDNLMRILGVTLPENKRMEIALTAIYGVGRSRARQILLKTRVDGGLSPKDLSVDQENAVRKEIEGFKIEGDLKREVAGNIKRLKDIKTYRGLRHSRHLPARGQRTKTNSRTVRGNTRKTMGSGRRKEEKT